MAGQRQSGVIVFRWLVLALASGYWIYQFHQMLDPARGFGWQFRYLTIWALSVSVLSAWAVLRLSLGQTDRRPETLAGLAVVMNGLVVYLYWRLYFADPAQVNGGRAIVWFQEFYLHLVGPLLQWIDAVFLLGVFRRPGPVLGLFVVLVLAYVGWAELIVQPMNDRPVGTVTRGLPYPFLNNMEFAQRMVFYAGSAALGLVIVAVGWAIQWRFR